MRAKLDSNVPSTLHDVIPVTVLEVRREFIPGGMRVIYQDDSAAYFDEYHRLHREKGYAVGKDGNSAGMYFIRGKQVTREFMESFSPEDRELAEDSLTKKRNRGTVIDIHCRYRKISCKCWLCA